MRFIAIAGLILSATSLVPPAMAQNRAQNLAQAAVLCADPLPVRAIEGCTAVILVGGEKAMPLFDARLNRGLAFAQKNQHLQAIADYDAALKLRPKDPTALQSRCWSHSVAGRLSQAIKDCNASLALRPNDPDTLEIRGFTWRKMRRFELSIADYNAALDLRPEAANSLYGRGVTKHDMGVLKDARADISAAQAIQPDIDAQYRQIGVHR